MSSVRLSEEHLTYLLFLLRNSPKPMTTDDLVRALRERLSR
ncbi:hypothetical protein [Sphaerobacter sp.]|mgnify:CR=1 FL=1|nr:hypothetical protein [Sphaerobacter sp.]